jgi:predicted dehydrogenase
MAERIRIGIAGAGKIVRDEHVPRLRAIEGVELVGVANRTRASSERAAAELGLGRAYADWGELVEDPDIDAVMVGTWPYLHAPVTVAALEFGKHVLTEARMASSADAARAMLAASMEHPGLVAQVVPASFSAWGDRAVQRVLASEIGRVVAVRVEWDGGAGDDPGEHWRWQRRYSGSNVMALGILVEAMARWLGFAEWVSAETRNYRPRKPGADGRPVPSDVPDHVVATAGYPGGVLATIEMSTVTMRGRGIRAWFHGSDGVLDADFGAQTLTVRHVGAPNEAGRPIDIRHGEHDEWRAERDFVDSIRGGRPVTDTDFATGLRYMEFVDAVHASAASGMRVELRGE